MSQYTPSKPQNEWQTPQQSTPQVVYQSQMQAPMPPNTMYPSSPPMYAPPVQVNVGKTGPNFLVRAIYFVFIGWWLGFLWLNAGYFLCVTVIGLPIGLVMLNHLPTVLTLRPHSQQVHINASGSTTIVNVGVAPQLNFLVRTVYFILIGWWFGYLWALLSYFLCMTVIGLPVGLVMLNRLPAVITLRRN
jgi:uncharacterized membrane protein YccF (DUF307 family)